MELKNKPVKMKDLIKPLLEEDEDGGFKLPEADVTPDGSGSDNSDTEEPKTDDAASKETQKEDTEKSEPTDEEKKKKRALILNITSEDVNGESSEEGTEDEEKAEMLKEYGLEESGLDKLIQASYKLLGLMSFLTAGEQEVRAWTIKMGTKAPKAAGKIHSDIERGFIRAEIVTFDDLVECGSEAKAKEKGLYRLEGKDYVMQDGDVVNFRFNV